MPASSIQEKYDELPHLYCRGCDDNPLVALLDGNEVLVCHCTHDDGPFDLVPIHGFETLPDDWRFITAEET